MTDEQIKAALQAIEEAKDDNEAAHGHEDDLYKDFIRGIANDPTSQYYKQAQTVLTAENIEYTRWYA